VTVAVLLASAALAAVAAATITWPYRRGRAAVLEHRPDPLEDERATLLRSLRDLEDERAAGAVSDEDYAALRGETEVRAVAVLRALDARDGGSETAAGVREIRSTRTRPGGPDHAGPNGSPTQPAGRRGAGMAALVVGVVLAVAIVPLLAGAVSRRQTGGSLTGDSGIAGSPVAGTADASLTALERRVRDHPADVAARLDLAERYVRDGSTGLAALQFGEALRLDPRNVEAHTGLAMILFAKGRRNDALFLVNEALREAPRDPEALYDRGLILLRGFGRTRDAREAFDAYLEAAPFGAHRDEVRRLLDGIPSSP
jgi:cytochrome c-type biogenesis protein CcmH/NrfG